MDMQHLQDVWNHTDAGDWPKRIHAPLPRDSRKPRIYRQSPGIWILQFGNTFVVCWTAQQAWQKLIDWRVGA